MYKKLNVLHVLGKLEMGGAEYRTLEMIKKLDRTKYNVHILSVGNSNEKGDLFEEFKKNVTSITKVKKNFLFPLKLRKIFQLKEIDIVHSHLFLFSGIIMKVANKAGVEKRITHIRTTGNPVTSGLREIKKYILRHYINKHSTKVVGVSKSVLSTIFGNEIDNSSKYKVIYNGFEVSKLKKNKAEKIDDSIFKEDTKKIIHVGRFSEAKNHKRLLEIFYEVYKKDNTVHLYLVGDGDKNIKHFIENFISTHNIENAVTLVGSVGNVLPYLKQADLFLYPSLWEGLPGAFIEAMYAGLPIVSSDIGPCKELSLIYKDAEILSLDENNEVWLNTIINRIRNVNQSEKELFCFQNSTLDINNTILEIEKLYDD